MPLQVIGAGFGRTGTQSMKEALERLGYVKCHHMKEVFKDKNQIALFEQASRGVEVDWDEVFTGFEASVDWPSAAYYKELADHYPDAKVILTARDADAWYASTEGTIYWLSNSFPTLAKWLMPSVRLAEKMVFRTIWDGTFDGRFEDRAHAIKVYNKHVEDVKAHVSSDRLLVHSAAEGWPPLCAFLDKPIPEEPYPHSNESKEIKRMVWAMKAISVLSVLLPGIAMVALALWLLR